MVAREIAHSPRTFFYAVFFKAHGGGNKNNEKGDYRGWTQLDEIFP